MRDTIRDFSEGNRIIYVLVSIVLLNVIYPISELSSFAALLFIGVYLVLTGSAIYLVSSNRRLLIIAGLLGGVIAVTGAVTIATGFTQLWSQLVWNISLFLQISLIIALLVLYILEAQSVTREVLFAAVAIYFLLAGGFNVLYILIETIEPGAFMSSIGVEITWQRLTYFSLVTISTLGYGDIVPVAPVAQSLAALETSIGTLYIAILIGRFVSLYQGENQKHDG